MKNSLINGGLAAIIGIVISLARTPDVGLIASLIAYFSWEIKDKVDELKNNNPL